MSINNNTPRLPPDLQQHAQKLNMQQQLNLMAAIAQLEPPAVMVNTVNAEAMMSLGVKLVFGEQASGVPNLPMKARCAVVLPWALALQLMEVLDKQLREAGVIMGSDSTSGVVRVS